MGDIHSNIVELFGRQANSILDFVVPCHLSTNFRAFSQEVCYFIDLSVSLYVIHYTAFCFFASFVKDR